jgi:NADH-quinone oxidoreductase subunit N
MNGLFAVLAQAEADEVVQIPVPSVDWRALLPLLILLVGALLMLTLSSLLRGKAPRSLWAGVTVALAVASAISVLPLWGRVQGWDQVLWFDNHPESFGPFSTVAGMVGIDGFSLFVTVVICAAVALAALIADGYLQREGMEGPEFFVLMLLSASGGVMMAMANDLLVIFLGLETLSIAVYVMSAMQLRRIQSQESGLKYFVLGAFS